MQSIAAIGSQNESLRKSTEILHERLIHLRYEGKAFRKNNYAMLRRITDVLNKSVKRHKKIQEKIIFSFIEKYIPRYAAASNFLETEHHDIELTGKKLAGYLKEASLNPEIRDGNVHETGIYWVALLRHHLGLEKKIYGILNNTLSREERAELRRRIKAWLIKERVKSS